MKLARVVRLDPSDLNVFDAPAEIGEWAVSGAFAFADLDASALTGKRRQAFANGWLGVESFGRATLVAVAAIEAAELDALAERLAAHFVAAYGAPNLAAARPAAIEELAHMRSLCEGLDDNALLTVRRESIAAGLREQFRILPAQAASLTQFTVHGAPPSPLSPPSPPPSRIDDGAGDVGDGGSDDEEGGGGR